MKRGGPLRRTGRLKSNAAKQREWEERTRRKRIDNPDHAVVVAKQVQRDNARRLAAKRRDSDLGIARERRKVMAGGACEANWEGVCQPGRHRGDHAHHVRLRSQGGPDTVENLLWICFPVHHHIHNVDRVGAEVRGLIRRAYPTGRALGDD